MYEVSDDSSAYDLIDKTSYNTVLTRKIIVEILKGISPHKFVMYKDNPEEFISKVSKLIKEQRATMIVEHISYDEIEEKYDTSILRLNIILHSIGHLKLRNIFNLMYSLMVSLETR